MWTSEETKRKKKRKYEIFNMYWRGKRELEI